MDPLTHGLASYALKRGFFPRAPLPVTAVMLIAGVVADLDWLSYFFGPSAFFSWHRTCAHSLLSATVVALLLGTFAFLVARKRGAPEADFSIFAPALLAALLHIAMDACQSQGVALFWPFRSTRIVFDWLPNFDLVIIAILLLSILLPELFLLVGSEIGVKAKRPRGRNGALAGLALLVVYVGLREIQHTNAMATLQAATYANESPRRVAAFPDSLSLFTWHGIAETQSALHLVDIPVAPGAYFNPGSAVTMHKPENSPILEAAQATPAARQFLPYARFPKATVEHETAGYSVEIRDLRNAAMQQTLGALEVNVDLDAAGNVTFAKLDWQKTAPRHN